ncbi:hypothetical protein [Streptomyces sp. NPDC059142]|uniref:hypothetical protein n=1 Tax=Streptomyces sp. NPDC059142 TaxID=3346739 RepID=UPI00368ABDD2
MSQPVVRLGVYFLLPGPGRAQRVSDWRRKRRRLPSPRQHRIRTTGIGKGAAASLNTEKAYGIRSALLLTCCSERGLNRKQLTLLDLARSLRWLVDEPLPPRSPRVASPPWFRLEKSANQVLGPPGSTRPLRHTR